MFSELLLNKNFSQIRIASSERFKYSKITELNKYVNSRKNVCSLFNNRCLSFNIVRNIGIGILV